GQIVMPNIVEYVGKTVRTEPFADDEAVFLEQGELRSVETKIKCAISGISFVFPLVHSLDVGVELIPILRGRRIPGNSRQITRRVREHRSELVRGNLPDAFQLLRKGVTVAEYLSPARAEFGDTRWLNTQETVESLRLVQREGHVERRLRRQAARALSLAEGLPELQIEAPLQLKVG